ncbi:thermosome subunit [Candidatus Micrarchaeota archaeon]|nr:thermosome subunit [Candidatus Micrarchaeota archaeon]
MSQGKLNGQQVLILPEGSSRLLGRDAQRSNIAVAYAVASAVKTTLGPRGMDKMMVSDMGDIVITNDGATILKEMNVEHPAAKMMVEIAKTQDAEVGDGTTSAVVLAGELLKQSLELLDQNIHPSTVITGYKKASKKAIEALSQASEKVDLKDTTVLEKIAGISMGSKTVSSGEAKNVLAKMVVSAVTQIAEKKGDAYSIDKDYIKLEKKQGGDVLETEVIKGVLIDKEVVHPGMPKSISNAKIALIDAAVEIEKTETDAKININSPEQMTAFLEQEEKMLKNMVEKIAASGCTVVFCQKGIDDVAQHYLSKKGITAARRVKKSDMEKLVRATGGRIVTTLDDLSGKDLGFAGLVEERKVAGEQMIFVEKCKDPKSVTILVRGSTNYVVDEAERSLTDALGAVSSAIEDGFYVTGGGSIEMELSVQLRKYAIEVGGREQLAIQAFADALEVIPRTLSESCGIDPIDAIVDLRSKHEKKNSNYGVDVLSGKLGDVKHAGVIEPLHVKKQAIQSASEAAEMILRIDDIIASRGSSGAPRGGMPPGMGGMDDM